MSLTIELASEIADLLNSQNQLAVRYAAEEILANEDRYIVHSDNGRLLGVVEVKRVQWYQCEIDHLSVVEKRRGLGQSLLRDAEKRATDLGASLCQCTIRVGNEASEGLFRACGYALTAKFVNEQTGNVVGVYQKVLQAPAIGES